MKAFKRTLALMLIVALSLGIVPSAQALSDRSPPSDSVAITEETSKEATTSVEGSVDTDPQDDVPFVEDVAGSLSGSQPVDGIPDVDSTEATVPTEEPEEVIPAESTEPSKPIEESVPAETEKVEETVPLVDLIPAETVGVEPSEPKDSVPMMDLIPSETLNPEEDNSLIRVGDTVVLSEDTVDYRSFARRSEQVVRWENLYSGEINFNYYVYDSGGSPVLSWSGGSVNEIADFVLSNQTIAYCLQPHKAGPSGSIYGVEFSSWDAIKRNGITRAMAYGAPNNGNSSRDCKLATALVIWDVACGYRRSDGQKNFSSTTPFEAVASRAGKGVKENYDTICYRMKLHGTIPSFTVKSEGSINNASTIILKQDANGNYVGSVKDTTGILSAFQFNSPIKGLTITRSGSTLNFKATLQAAASMTGGVVIRSRRSSAPIRDTDLLVWTKDGTSPSSGRGYQEIVSMPGGIDPVPCFFKLKAVLSTGAMSINKTSNGPVDGFCFKVYRWQNSQTWYGKSDSTGKVKVTDSNFNGGGSYTFTGLYDGDYSFREVLSKSTHGKESFPTSWEIIVKDPSGKQVNRLYFDSTKIQKTQEGDAILNPSKVTLHGLTGGGTLTIKVHNESTSSGFTLKKSVKQTDKFDPNSLKGNKCYSLEGAKYNVLYNGAVKETLVTDKYGNAKSRFTYPVGATLYIEESVAPKGFKLDKTRHKLVIGKGTNAISVSDEPSFDPRTIQFGKIDKQTGTPQGNASFEGAVFKWEYFDNYKWEGAPLRVWYFRTNSRGLHMYSEEFLSKDHQSSPLYTGLTGRTQLPLGSLKVTEISAPEGYGTIQDLFATITLNANGDAKLEWTDESFQIVSGKDGNYEAPEPIDVSTFGKLSIKKSDSSYGATVPEVANFNGCEFTVYNNSKSAVYINNKKVLPGEPCVVLTTDSSGNASTDAIFPIGSYTVKETKGNDYYQCNTEWSGVFEVTKENTANPTYSLECKNTLKPANVSIEKVDPLGSPLSGAKFTLEWSEDNLNWFGVTKGDHIYKGLCSSQNLDNTGCITTDATGRAEFTGLDPTLYYRLVEVETPDGFTLLSEPVYIGRLTPDTSFTVGIRIVNSTAFVLPMTGSSELVFMGMTASISAVMSVVAFMCFNKKRKKG